MKAPYYVIKIDDEYVGGIVGGEWFETFEDRNDGLTFSGACAANSFLDSLPFGRGRCRVVRVVPK